MFFQPPYFPALCNYIAGVEDCFRTTYHPVHLELVSFDGWLCGRFGISLPSFRWQQVISERVTGDGERLRLFIDLYLEHRRALLFNWDRSPQLLAQAPSGTPSPVA